MKHIIRMRRQRILLRPLGLGHDCYKSSYYECMSINRILGWVWGTKFKLSVGRVSFVGVVGVNRQRFCRVFGLGHVCY